MTQSETPQIPEELEQMLDERLPIRLVVGRELFKEFADDFAIFSSNVSSFTNPDVKNPSVLFSIIDLEEALKRMIKTTGQMKEIVRKYQQGAMN